MTSSYLIRGVRPLLAVKLFCSLAKHIRLLTLSWLIFERTRSPLALGYIGLAEAIPYIASILWAGQYVDRTEKSRVLFYSVVGSLLCSVAFVSLMTSTSYPLWFFYLVIGALGITTSYYTVSTNAYLQSLLTKERYAQVYALNVGLYQTGIIAGPIAAGCVIGAFNAQYSMIVVAFLELLSLCCIINLPAHHPAKTIKTTSALENIREGLSFIKIKKIIWAPMLLDMVAVLFGDVVAILPVFATLLEVGPEGLGFLRAAPAVGGLFITLSESISPWITLTWNMLLKVVALFGVCMILFALSNNFYLAALFLLLSGVADAMSVIIRQTTYQAHTPEEFRGRVASVNGIFVRTSNEIGAFESGLAAQLLGPVPSVVFGGLVAIGVVGVMRWKVPNLEESSSTSRT